MAKPTYTKKTRENELSVSPCIFCGNPHSFVNFKADYSKYWVQCNECTAHGSWCNTPKEAIKAWNKAFEFDSFKSYKKYEIYTCFNCPIFNDENSYCNHPESDFGTREVYEKPLPPGWCPLRECPTIVVFKERDRSDDDAEQ